MAVPTLKTLALVDAVEQVGDPIHVPDVTTLERRYADSSGHDGVEDYTYRRLLKIHFSTLRLVCFGFIAKLTANYSAKGRERTGQAFH